MLRISDFATLAQVSVRLLHYYDEIGLLTPARTDPDTGYRYYSVGQLPRLNRILALRELGLSLGTIGTMLRDNVTADEIRAILQTRQTELKTRIAEDQTRLAQAEMRLQSIEHEGRLPNYDVVMKQIAPEWAVTAQFGFTEGQNPIDFFARARDVLRASGLRPHTSAVVGIYLNAFVIYRQPHVRFPYQPAYLMPRDVAIPLNVPGYGALQPQELPGYPLAASTIHEAPYNKLYGAHLALLHWAEVHGLQPAGIVREVYLRDQTAEHPPLVEVQMPFTE